MTRLTTERMYTGRVIDLDVDTVRFPDGSTGQLEMIRHPGAAAAGVVADDVESGLDDPTPVRHPALFVSQGTAVLPESVQRKVGELRVPLRRRLAVRGGAIRHFLTLRLS